MKQNAFQLGLLTDSSRFHNPIEVVGFQRETLTRWLSKLLEIRCAEEKIGDEFRQGVIRCPCHLAIGQEATAVGFADHVRAGDRVFGAHRSHGHFLALGGSLRRLFAEVLGKETGCSKGMGGSMHLVDIEHRFFGSVPIVGATIPIATGAGLAAKMDGMSDIAISFFGDGATEEGIFHESLNFASIMKLPVIYFVENNLFSSHLHISLRQPFDSICRFAEAHGLPWQRIDGNDIIAVSQAAEAATAHARAGKGPQLIEAVTYRWRGHVGHREDNDVGLHRTHKLGEWKKRDPIARLIAGMVNNSYITPEVVDNMLRDCRFSIQEAWDQAVADPYPLNTSLLARVYRDIPRMLSHPTS